MKEFIVSSLLSLFACCFCVSAQSSDPNLEDVEVREAVIQQCIHQVKTLTCHFAEIANKEIADSIKDYHIEACLELFIGRGNDTKDEDGNIIFSAPRIEVSSPISGRVNSYLIKDYLMRLKSLQYSKIEFKTVSVNLVNGGIKKVGENLFLADVSFYQVFVGDKDNLIVYRDKTKKTGKVLIEKDNLGRINVLLGDIQVDQTDLSEKE